MTDRERGCFIRSLIDRNDHTPHHLKKNKQQVKVSRSGKKEETGTADSLSEATEENLLVLSAFAKDMWDKLALMEKLESGNKTLKGHIKIYNKLNGKLQFEEDDNREEMESVLAEHYPALDEWYTKTHLPNLKKFGLQYTDESTGKRAKTEHDSDELDFGPSSSVDADLSQQSSVDDFGVAK